MRDVTYDVKCCVSAAKLLYALSNDFGSPSVIFGFRKLWIYRVNPLLDGNPCTHFFHFLLLCLLATSPYPYLPVIAPSNTVLDDVTVMGKSQIKSQVQITNHLQKLFKSKPQIRNQITNNQIKSKSFFVQIKSNHKSILPKCQFFENVQFI